MQRSIAFILATPWAGLESRFLGGEKAVCGSFRAVSNTATALGAMRTTHETRR
jgi:hypothetical protein